VDVTADVDNDPPFPGVGAVLSEDPVQMNASDVDGYAFTLAARFAPVAFDTTDSQFLAPGVDCCDQVSPLLLDT